MKILVNVYVGGGDGARNYEWWRRIWSKMMRTIKKARSFVKLVNERRDESVGGVVPNSSRSPPSPRLHGWDYF